jgi:hypothetical protein
LVANGLNIVGLLMVYLDVSSSATVSLSATAHYTTPFEVVTKLWIIPGALAATLYPAFAAATRGDARGTTRLFAHGSEMMFYAMVPVAVIVIAFAREGLQMWLGSDFAEKSTLVAQILALGIVVNAMAFVPMALIQGAGRADIAARLHLVELPLYLASLGAGSGRRCRHRGRRVCDCVALTGSRRFRNQVTPLRSLFLTASATATPAASPLTLRIGFFVTVAIAAIASVVWVRLRGFSAVTINVRREHTGRTQPLRRERISNHAT